MNNFDRVQAGLPAPMTPVDCDLRDFPWMPVSVAQLTKSKSWLRCKRKPELAFYMMNLWMTAWHEVPAASLDDDDDLLCDIAACDPERWPEVRDEVLRNWVKCSDGRLYHETVAERAIASWSKKLGQRKRTQAATQAATDARKGRENKGKVRNGERNGDRYGLQVEKEIENEDNNKYLVLGKESEKTPVGFDAQRSASPGAHDASLKFASLPKQANADFERFWKAYPRKASRGQARKAWSIATKKAPAETIIAAVRSHPFDERPKFRPYPAKWLDGERWLDDKAAKLLPGQRSEQRDMNGFF